MASTKLSTIVGGGGAALIMPVSSYITAAAIRAKSAVGTQDLISQTAFWTTMDVSHTALGYETVKLAAAANSDEQTILDITDAGVLTNVISPSLSGSGTMTIRVTADGAETVFISETMAAAGRFCLGALFPGGGQTSTAGCVGVGSNVDAGFAIANEIVSLTTPTNILSITSAGIVFKTSLKVTIQGSVNITSTAEQLNGLANYALAVPGGL